MKRLLSIITIILFIFGLKINVVKAGVCDGKSTDNSGYCITSGVSFTRIEQKISNYYFLPIGFNATTYLENDSVAFCIDPALLSPTVSYSYKRELNLNTAFDKKVFAMYQNLINSFQWAKENSSDDSYVNGYKATFEAALRTWTIKYGFDYVTADNIAYVNEAKNFVNCADQYIDDSILCAEGEDGCTYNSSKFAVSKKNEKDCFGSNYYVNLVNGFYNASNIIWNDPFENSSSITSQIVSSSENGNYIVTFTVNFGTFFQNGSGGFLNLEDAKFESTILINDIDCSTNSCNVLNINNNFGTGVKTSLTSASTNLVYTIEITPEQYLELFSNGNGKITLKYNYNHPMNLDNVYFSRKNASNADEQRMFVIYNYNEERTNDLSINAVLNKCTHISTLQFIDSTGKEISSLSDYILSCGCTNVDVNKIGLSDLEIYNNKCLSGVSVTGGLKACTVNSPLTENYNITYKKSETVNNYCNMTCTESIYFNNVTGKYKNIRAGTYLELYNYPTTIAKKNCILNVSYNDWYDDYKKALEEAVDAYNDYAKNKAIVAAFSHEGRYSYKKNCSKTDLNTGVTTTKTACGSCGDNWISSTTDTICDTDYYYNTSTYDKVYISEDATNKTLSLYTVNTNTGVSGWQESKKTASSTTFNSKISVVNGLLNSLNVCNSKLSDYGNDKTFYNYQEVLNINYQQTLSDFTILDKEETLISSETTNSGGSYDLAKKNYATLTTSGRSTIEIKNIGNYTSDYTLDRYVEYIHNFKLETKVTKSYLGGIHNNGNNLIELGDVLDIDVTTINKSDNEYSFKFSQLGDNNQIYEYYDDYDQLDSLKRYCTYGTINDLMCIPGTGDSDCPTGTSVSSKIIFKIVDSDNIDPNDRLSQNNKGFENWKDKTIVKDALEESDTFNPENLEYSFELDSLTIKAIREYNETTSYLDYNYDCDEDGNYCLSKFIDYAVTGNLSEFDESFATIYNGRDKWKTLTDDFSSIYEVKVSS